MFSRAHDWTAVFGGLVLDGHVLGLDLGGKVLVSQY